MNFADYSNSDTVNGDGIRCSLWISGCSLNCSGCFSPKTHDFNYGKYFNKEFKDRILNDLQKPYISGLSILGGHMFELQTIDIAVKFLEEVKLTVPEKTIYVWTGLKLQQIQNIPKYETALQFIDVLIDGRFDRKLFKPDLYLRGSTNQNILYAGKDF